MSCDANGAAGKRFLALRFERVEAQRAAAQKSVR